MSLPAIYSFPPLYTRQPNAIIRNKQIDSWINILLQYSKIEKIWELDSNGIFLPNEISLFENNSINRSVNNSFIKEILNRMKSDHQIIYNNNNDTNTFFILWKNLDSWASLILEWFETTNKLNQVVTFYEISSGDESINWEFHTMPSYLISKILQILVKRGRATILKDEYNKDIAIKVV